jgi:hypothetical protein
MPDLIDDATYESMLRRKWFVPGAHEAPDELDGLEADEELALTAGESLRFWGVVSVAFVVLVAAVVTGIAWVLS